MIYDFDNPPSRKNTNSIKWQAYGEDVLPMWVADMDFVAPQPVQRALRQQVEHGIFGYPGGIHDPIGDLPCLQATIIERLEHLYGWQIQPQDILLIPGLMVGFNLAAHALGAPGDGLLIQTPVYMPFLDAAKNAALIHQEMELTRCADGRYEIDFDAFSGALTPETRAFLLCNPHNPVGRVFDRHELERMAELCLRNNTTIISDEIHCDLIFPDHRHIPIASLDPEIAQNTITLMAPSKTYNIAGLSASFAIIQNEALRQKWDQAKEGLVGWVNLMGQVAMEAAYAEGQEWLDQVLVYLKRNRDLLFETVQCDLPGIKMALPEGTYLAWLDCREAGIPGNPYQFFLNEARVAVNDGAAFGKGGEGFVRLNFGCPRSTLLEGLRRIQNALPR